MNTGLHEESVANAELAERSVSAGAGQLALFSIFVLFTRFSVDFSALTWITGCVIVGFNILRITLGLRYRFISLDKTWCWLFAISITAPALAWGFIFFMALMRYGPATYTTAVCLLLGSGISAASTASLSPRQSLARVFLTLILGLPFIALVYNMNWRTGPLGLIFVAYYIFLWEQLKIQSSVYWKSVRTQGQLALESQRLKGVLDAIPGLVCWISPDRKIQGVNESYATYFGGHTQDYLRQDVTFRNSNANCHEVLQEFMVSSEQRTVHEMPLADHAGRRWHLIIMRKVSGDTYLVCVDIHDQKMAQAELEKQRIRSEKASKLAALGEVASGIAHEIRNPLSATTITLGLIKRALKEPPSPERIAELADKALSTCARIDKIINGLSQFSRATDREPYVVVKVGQIIQDSRDLIERLFFSNDVSLLIDKVEQDLLVKCRPVEISQVVVNLLTNALYASKTQKEKWVRIHVEATKGEVIIAISDSGPGIPADLSGRIFLPFFTTKPSGKGTGLGLSISKKIIESHKGKLELDPHRPNTTFLIKLPKFPPSKSVQTPLDLPLPEAHP